MGGIQYHGTPAGRKDVLKDMYVTLVPIKRFNVYEQIATKQYSTSLLILYRALLQ